MRAVSHCELLRPLLGSRRRRPLRIPTALMNFEGYGGRARILFIGIEERRRERKHLEVRLTFPKRIDLKEAHDLMFGRDWWGSEEHRLRVPVWSTAARILAELYGQYDEEAVAAIRNEVLGRVDGETLLAELLPVPLPKSGEWSAEEVALTGFKEYKAYRRAVLGFRKESGPRTAVLRAVIEKDKPEYVFCYGIKQASHFKRLFPDLRGQWTRVDPSESGGEPLWIVRGGGTRVAVTRHFAPNESGRWFKPAGIPNLLRTLDRTR